MVKCTENFLRCNTSSVLNKKGGLHNSEMWLYVYFFLVCNYDFAKGEPDCDAVAVPKCPPGYVPEQTNVGECIPTYECICNMTRNPCSEAPKCNEDLEELITTETECCPIQTCGMFNTEKHIL